MGIVNLVSISLRNNTVPAKSLVLLIDQSTIPSDYTIESSLFNKYIKQVPNACTNPGGCVGSASHTHSAACHTHCASGVGACHAHSGNTSPSFVGNPVAAATTCTSHPTTSQTHSRPGHNHSYTTASCDPGVTIGNNGPHTHNAQCNDPSFITARFIKKTDSQSMRRTQIPQNGLVMWACPIACIPSQYAVDTNTLCRFPKGVPNACTLPGVTGGRSTHEHDCITHTHSACVPNHSSHAGFTTGEMNAPYGWYRPFTPNTPILLKSHTHGAGPASFGASGASSACVAPAGHTHGTTSTFPQYSELAYIKKPDITMRKSGLPAKTIVGWVDTLATIPPGLALTDGTLCTPNLLAKFPKGVATACTCPGTTGGGNCHTHAGDTHSHGAVNVCHSHTIAGTTATTSTFNGLNLSNSCGAGTSGSHNHSYPASTPTHNIPIGAASGDGHTHDTLSIQPPTINVALIQKV